MGPNMSVRTSRYLSQREGEIEKWERERERERDREVQRKRECLNVCHFNQQ